MTGFAAAAGPDWRWEARSVNHRGLDLRLRLPAGCDGLEPAVRKTVQGAVPARQHLAGTAVRAG